MWGFFHLSIIPHEISGPEKKLIDFCRKAWGT